MKTKLIAALTITTVSALVAQGPLTPPGAPAPTMKTLQQIEPRIEINATNTPGDADSIFKITEPGSYYLTGNVAGVSGKHGIEIAASDVTLDLMGFSLTGVGGTLSGIVATSGSPNLVIRNGGVRNWGQWGVEASNASSSQFEGLRLSGNTGNGLVVGSYSTVSHCTARTNTFNGIVASGDGITIDHCTAAFNGTAGISPGITGTVIACTANSNSGPGINASSNCVISDSAVRDNGGAAGLVLGNGSTARNCVSDTNRAGSLGITGGRGCMIIHCVATNNPAGGIMVSERCLIQDCVADGNAGDGIHAGNACRIIGNHCANNISSDRDAAGVNIAGFASSAEGNTCFNNEYGVLSAAPGGGIVIKSVASGNTVDNYSFGIATVHGEVVVKFPVMPPIDETASAWANLEINY